MPCLLNQMNNEEEFVLLAYSDSSLLTSKNYGKEGGRFHSCVKCR